MIKITYETTDGKMKKPEETSVQIFQGRMFVRYNVSNKAKTVVEQMQRDGKKGVLFSRGMMIQNFAGKSEDEILEIVKKDIKAGVYIAEEKTKKKLTIQNYKEDRI